LSPGKLVLIDEYQLGDWSKFDPVAIFGDPLQVQNTKPIEAHFVQNKTFRFGSNTAELLRSFGFDIYSDLQDEVKICWLYKTETEGEIVACEPEVYELLERHSAPFKKVSDIRGSTFEVVTFVTACGYIPECMRADFFVCLTRHRKKLLIFTPYAAFAASRSY